MTDENCLYCSREGECIKGLPGTPCEIEGCVAHTPVGYLSWGDMTDKQKEIVIGRAVPPYVEGATTP
jgi:hypothetical protein